MLTVNLQNLQQQNKFVISDQNNTDYGEGSEDGATVKFIKPKSLNQIVVIIQTHTFL